MAKAAIGFYWTLPVPWAGFSTLPADAEAAATASRTIRYQRELIHRYAADEGWPIIEEIPFLEIAPDRSSDYVEGPLRRAAALCRTHDAILLAVDFSVLNNSRSHPPLQDHARHLGIDLLSIAAGPVTIDGVPFDPHHHFRAWRERQSDWTARKSERQTELQAAVAYLRATGLTWTQVADRLTQDGVPSATGKPHTADSVRRAAASRTSPAKS